VRERECVCVRERERERMKGRERVRGRREKAKQMERRETLLLRQHPQLVNNYFDYYFKKLQVPFLKRETHRERER